MASPSHPVLDEPSGEAGPRYGLPTSVAPPHDAGMVAAETANEPDDAALVERLRAGDEEAFRLLLDRYDAVLRRTARTYVATDAAADEVVQDTWLGVLRGIDRFEQRSSLKTWIFRILMNIARTRGVRDKRSTPFSSLGADGEDDDGPTFAPDRFQGPDARYPGHWAAFPTRWHDHPEVRAVGHETLAVVREALGQLPPAQQEVVRLRDLEGWTSEEVRNALDLTETNQRVLLHRGRAKLRAALERYFDEAKSA
jgi:RNA polymerase sigma-70 factor (ECF subfamily)